MLRVCWGSVDARSAQFLDDQVHESTLCLNIELVCALREELGAEAMLMFDGIQYVWKSVGPDRVIADYAVALARGILPYKFVVTNSQPPRPVRWADRRQRPSSR